MNKRSHSVHSLTDNSIVILSTASSEAVPEESDLYFTLDHTFYPTISTHLYHVDEIHQDLESLGSPKPLVSDHFQGNVPQTLADRVTGKSS